MTIREQLRVAYTQSGMRHVDIADRAGVHENTVMRILTGQNATVESLIAVASVLGVRFLEIDPPSTGNHNI